MRHANRGKYTKRVQVCLTPTQYSTFKEIASKIFPEGDGRTDGVDESNAGRQIFIDWIRANGHVLQEEMEDE